MSQFGTGVTPQCSRLRVTCPRLPLWLRKDIVDPIYCDLDLPMPKTATILQVFVASPSDVAAEREQLEVLITEMNKAWGRSLGVICELLRWETNVRPAFGAEPQAVINSQIGDDSDIFIGILWSRFGTATSSAESGTIEEFDRAYMRMQNVGKPEIMIYFKDTPISPSKLEPADLQKIQIFKNSIGNGEESTRRLVTWIASVRYSGCIFFRLSKKSWPKKIIIH